MLTVFWDSRGVVGTQKAHAQEHDGEFGAVCGDTEKAEEDYFEEFGPRNSASFFNKTMPDPTQVQRQRKRCKG